MTNVPFYQYVLAQEPERKDKIEILLRFQTINWHSVFLKSSQREEQTVMTLCLFICVLYFGQECDASSGNCLQHIMEERQETTLVIPQSLHGGCETSLSRSTGQQG